MNWVEYLLHGSLDLKTAPDRIQDNGLQRARGVGYDESGSISTENGRRRIGKVSDLPVRGEGDAVLSGTRRRITKSNATLFKDMDSIGAFGDADSDITVIPYNDYVYVTDGTAFKRYNETKAALEAVGLDAPTTAITEDSTGTSGYLKTGTYKWVYTFFNGVAESNFSEVFEKEFSSGSTNDITLDIAAGGATVTERRIYRTDLNGTAFYRVGKLADNTTLVWQDTGGDADDAGKPPDADPDAEEEDEVTDQRDKPNRRRTSDSPFPNRPWRGSGPYQGDRYKPSDTAKDDYDESQLGNDIVMTNLGLMASWTDHDPPPTGLRGIKYIKDVVYGIEGNNLRFTRVTNPEYWSPYYSIPIGRQTGEELLTAEPLSDAVACYTTASIWMFKREGFNAANSLLAQTPIQVGGVSRECVTVMEDGSHLFMGEKAIYRFDGQQAVEISFPIEKLFTDPTHEDYIADKSKVVCTSMRDKAWFSYRSGKTEENDRTIHIDFQDPQNPKYSVLPYGYTALHRDLDNRAIGGDEQGNLYYLDEGNGNGVEDLEWAFTTKSFPLGGTTRLETYDKFSVDADLGGAETLITLTTDEGKSTQFTFNWHGRKRIERWLPAYMTGRTVKMSVQSKGRRRRHFYSLALGVEQEVEP